MVTTCQVCVGVPNTQHAVPIWAVGTFQLTPPRSVEPPRGVSAKLSEIALSFKYPATSFGNLLISLALSSSVKVA
nr:hypothetical protein [Peribacillus sp. BBB004]